MKRMEKDLKRPKGGLSKLNALVNKKCFIFLSKFLKVTFGIAVVLNGARILSQ